MNRPLGTMLIVAASIGIGMMVSSSRAQTAAETVDSLVEPSLAGKAVIIEREGWRELTRENVRFVAVAHRGFLVVPMKQEDGKSYEYWQRLDDIVGLKVFDSMEEATAYKNSR
ncbi:MAG: hypothetical protein KDA92_07935 [Planctomycetales bacterium]|nr:hypothetical protein [Planctomycetales bacterium]MCA9167198.1 hypothetical protein [Planctomycetales bacterium]